MDEAKRYETFRYVVSITGLLIDATVLIYLLTSGWSARIRDVAVMAGEFPWVSVLIYMLVIGTIFKLIEFPLSVYSGYVIEHRFALSRQTFRAWLSDYFKSLALGAFLGVAGAELIYFFLRSYPDQWWIYGGLTFAGVAIVFANLAPVLLLPLFFKFRPVQNEELQQRVARLARQTKTPVCGIYEWSLGEKTRKANAAVVGWGNTRRIIVSDTLLENCSGEELEVIMAHELCHHVKHHIWLTIAAQSALTFILFYAVFRVLPGMTARFGLIGPADVAGMPIIMLVFSILSLLALPAWNFFSRHLETVADLYALDVTGDSLAFVSSMEKLADLSLADKSPNPVIEFIFYSHPSAEKRIKLAADRVGQIV
jgi:STE24 endopeptidase